MTGFANIALGLTLFATGCINRATARLSPGAGLTKFKMFYESREKKPISVDQGVGERQELGRLQLFR